LNAGHLDFLKQSAEALIDAVDAIDCGGLPGPRRLSELGRSGKKKLFRNRVRGAAMRCEGFRQDRDEGSNVPGDSLSRQGGVWSGDSSSAKMLADQQDLEMDWSGMVLQMRIVVELCCTVLCSALATVGDLRRGPCWHRIGWRGGHGIGHRRSRRSLSSHCPRLPRSPSPEKGRFLC
jgi:hypothetical protein